MVLSTLSASAQKEIYLGDGLSLVIPSSITEVNHQAYLYAGADSMCLIAVSKLEKQDYDKDKVKDNLDRVLFNLKDYREVDSKTEGLLEKGKDYKLKFYQGSKGLKIATYTSYVYEYPYCIMLQYADEAALHTLTAVIDSEHYDSSWWHTVWTFISRNVGLLCVVYILMLIVCITIHKEWFGFLFGLGISIWLCSPLWGMWSVWLPIVALGSFMGVAASSSSFEEAARSAIDGI